MEILVEGGEVWFQSACSHEVDSGEEGAVDVECVFDQWAGFIEQEVDGLLGHAQVVA